MKETLLSTKDPEGVGLAAPQVGKLLRIFIIRSGRKITTFINPKITWRSKKLNTDVLSEKEQYLEGCLSIPQIYGLVKRPHEIKIQYLNEKGTNIKDKYKGFTSANIQHEYDHLEGVLFTSRVLKEGEKLYKLDGEKWKEVDI